MKRLAFLVVLCVLATTSTTVAQEPPWPDGWFDLQADSITYSFPAPDSILVVAHFSLRNAMTVGAVLNTDLAIYLDGVNAFSAPLTISNALDPCFGKSEADCEGDCEKEIVGKGTEEGWCEFWKDPRDTLFATCTCRVWSDLWSISRYSGESTVSFEMDTGNQILEPYEDNNFCTVAVQPVAVKPRTWGLIKSEYKE
jgi:hypothetical protein